MSAAPKLAGSAELSSWEKICEQYPGEWVCLLDIERDADGLISTARIVSHDPSIERALDMAEPDPDTTVVHTAGLPFCMPRFEIRDDNSDELPSHS